MFRALSLLAVPTLALAVGLSSEDPRAQDRKLVERVALDYVEAFVEGKPELLDRCLDPKLDKLGFYRDQETKEYHVMTMTFAEAKELAKSLKAEGHVPEGATHKIAILDIMDKTAAVKVEGFWGVDYMNLIKESDTWKIRQVVWQSAPEEKSSGEE